MYTIIINDNNELVTSIRERVMQRSKLVAKLHFLMNPTYKEFDMTKFTAVMEYVLPVSREVHTDILTKSDELHKGMIEYVLPFDTSLTREAGEVEFFLTFTSVEMDENGMTTQYVRKTSPTTISIIPVPAWCDLIPDGALDALDKRIIALDARVKALDDLGKILTETKADNIYYDENGKFIQLTSMGLPIGNKIPFNGGSASGIASLEIDANGDLIVHYSDGKIDNVGHVKCDCTVKGIYVPSISEDGILSFTLQDAPATGPIEYDIDKSNDWNEVLSNGGGNSNYIWEII